MKRPLRLDAFHVAYAMRCFVEARRQFKLARRYEKDAVAFRNEKIAGSCRHMAGLHRRYGETCLKEASSLRRALVHEAELEAAGLFSRVEVYVKAIAFRPLGTGATKGTER